MIPRHFPIGFLLALLIASCSTEIRTPGEELRFAPQTLEPAYVNEPYSVSLRVVGGLAPYLYQLEEGELPSGIQLQGGFIRGTPAEVGSWTFTIAVSDANLSRNFRQFTLQVSEPPPARLLLNVPQTEMREPFLIRVEVEEARELSAFRTLLSWDASRFTLNQESLRAIQNNLALFSHYEEGLLHVDMAVLGGSVTGRQGVFEFELVPLEPSTIGIEAHSEFLSFAGQHAFSQTREGIIPLPVEAEEGAEADPEDDLEDDLEEDPEDDLEGEL